MIPQSFLDSLLQRVDIVEVVGAHVQLKKAGANLSGLCPFHTEKSPSFTVSPTKQFYHCFGCGAHGDAIRFLMEHAGLGYVDAIHELAREIGMTVPDEGPGKDAKRADPDLLDTLALAARFYKLRLKDTPRAVEYLKGRGVSGETAARFGIGYAPEGWRGLEAAVPDYSARALVESGLVIESESDEGEGGARRRRYDRFRDRVMFPSRNPRGQVIGFGGRVLDDSRPKYMNSPETPVFSKGRELYGLHEAREAIRRHDCVVVVEGYMDVVMLAQHGIDNAVATLGTSTTADHVRKLLRMADRVVFAFDGDKAGRKAAWRALEASLPQMADAKRVDFLFLPPEHDPDSFVRANGQEGFRQALAGGLPLSELMLRELSERNDLDSPEGRARFLTDAGPLLEQLAAPALSLQLVHRVAELARLSVNEVGEYFETVRQRGAGQVAAGRAQPDQPRRAPSVSGPALASRAAAQGRTRRIPAGRPDLEARVRWLVALHPCLAADIERGEWLSQALAGWIDAVARLPGESSLAQVAESLRAFSPSQAAQIDRGRDADAAALADLSLDEAASELRSALGQLRDRLLRRQIDELARSGIRTDEDRQRYQQLVAMRRKLLDTMTG
jgi:DNA primase